MAVYLGNLSTEQIAERLSIKMTDEDITEMEKKNLSLTATSA